MHSTKPHYDVVIPDHYFCDLIFTGLPDFPALGAELYSKALNVVPGGALNTVIALRRLGINVGWIGEVGDDFFSHYVMHRVEDEGIDTSLLIHHNAPFQRVTVSLSYPHDRAFISHVDESLDEIEMGFMALERASFRHLHLTSLEVSPRVLDLIRACHARGICVSMDCQHHELSPDTPLLRDILSEVDVFMPNNCEAQKLTGTHSLDDAFAALSEFVSYLVIKCGAEGVVAGRGGVRYHAPAINVDPIDTTGAGDVFNAGFLYGHLRGYDTATCLRCGNFCGGMSTQGVGGTATAPTGAQLEAWLAASPSAVFIAE